MRHDPFPPREDWQQLYDPALQDDDVSGAHFGIAAIAAVIVTSAIVFAINPSGAWAALASTIAF